jgi:hypothetical protein
MKRSHKKWTAEEELNLLEMMSNNPTNLVQAMRDYAEQYNRSYCSVRNRYYKKLKHTSTCFFIATNKIAVKNTKNGKVVKQNKIKKSLFTRIKEIFKHI